MCGIFGHVGKLDRGLAERCLHTLSHRGPDGWGLWQGDGVTLGHRRLAILDLSENGKQPMSYGNGRYWITFNGEIYNFLEIRAELEALGHVFRSESDTEVILAAYAQWGEGCLARFNGMWAFAIWDTVERSLFLARDRFGKKPLFYAELPNGEFAFASEMKALLPLLPAAVPDRAMIRGMTLRSSFAYEATERCLIAGVKRFLAGHCGKLSGGRLRSQRWWNTLDHLPQIPARYEEQVEMMRNLLTDACRLRMRSDVTIGTALSGGLDSSAIFSLLAHINREHHGEARLAGDWQHAFVASFPGTPLDEAQFAQQVARHAGIDATILPVDPARHIDQLQRMLYLYEDLTVTSPLPFVALYGQIKRAGVTVTLDGHAADELFGGYSTDWAYALVDAGLDRARIDEVLDVYDGGIPQARASFAAPADVSVPTCDAWALRWPSSRLACTTTSVPKPRSIRAGRSSTIWAARCTGKRMRSCCRRSCAAMTATAWPTRSRSACRSSIGGWRHSPSRCRGTRRSGAAFPRRSFATPRRPTCRRRSLTAAPRSASTRRLSTGCAARYAASSWTR